MRDADGRKKEASKVVQTESNTTRPRHLFKEKLTASGGIRTHNMYTCIDQSSTSASQQKHELPAPSTSLHDSATHRLPRGMLFQCRDTNVISLGRCEQSTGG